MILIRPGFSLRNYGKSNSIGTCAEPFSGAGTHFDKIGQIDLKLGLVEKRLTCSLRDLRTWSGCWTSSNHTCIVLFLSFVRYQQKHCQDVFN